MDIWNRNDNHREDERSWTDLRSVADGSSAGKGMAIARGILSIFKWTLIILILLLIFNHYISRKENHAPVEALVMEMTAVPHQCQFLPPHGSALVIDPSVMNRTDVLYSGLQINNQHDHPMVAILSDTSDSTQYFAVSISPSNTVQFSVPVGQYGMRVFVGSEWCNLETGFSDGAQILVDGGILVHVGKTTALEFYGWGIDPVQLALAYSSFRPVSPGEIGRPSEIIGAGELELLQASNGHYFSSGTINDAPVVFLIDTGATNVSISSEIAMHAGIQKCQSHQVMTANGSVDACKTTVPEITFGAFQLTNVEVTVMPNMSEEALLGMNVLRNFRIEQVDKVMRISLR